MKTREGLKAARERLNQRDQSRGTSEEYMRHELELYYEMKSLRDRANAAKELYYRLKHKETLERLQEGAKVCGPDEINEIIGCPISSTENPVEFQNEYERFWEAGESGNRFIICDWSGTGEHKRYPYRILDRKEHKVIAQFRFDQENLAFHFVNMLNAGEMNDQQGGH